jgi:predicted acyltransferase
MNQTSVSSSVPSNAHTPFSERIQSVDALRGFDMFWIAGGEAVLLGLAPLSSSKVVSFLCGQLDHKPWDGFAFYDLIFPLFVFLVGFSIVFSLGRLIEREGKTAAYKRLGRRFVILFLLGVIYYGGFSNMWPDMRLMGVLQRLALCYLFAGLLFCNLKWRGLLAVCISILVGYWILLSFVPVPGVGSPSITMDVNWAHYIDEHYLPGKRLYGNGTWDPEGILSTLPAISSCLLGVFAGMLLKNHTISNNRKAAYMFGMGVILVTLGYLWGMQFPIVKKIWTSSFVLVAGGYSFLLLAIFFTLIDIWKIQGWAKPFFWIGANSITIYMVCGIFSFWNLSERLVGGNICKSCNSYGNLLLATVNILLVFLFARFLYNRKVFLRV